MKNQNNNHYSQGQQKGRFQRQPQQVLQRGQPNVGNTAQKSQGRKFKQKCRNYPNCNTPNY